MTPTEDTIDTATSKAPGSGSSSVNVSRLIAGIVVLAALVVAARYLGGYIPQFAQWVDDLGFWGPFVFVLGYAAATVAFVPGSLLTLAAGAIFGIAEGTLYAFLGATTGAILAFLVGRYFARSAIEKKIDSYPRFSAIDSAVGKQGLKIVTLLRLSPAFPFVFLNYALGLTGVRLRDYALASFGMLPGTLLYVYYGKVIGNVATLASGEKPERGIGGWVVLAVGLVATLVVTVVITRMARRALAEATDLDQSQESSR